jgi:4-diphosphocytidyl-2-C-methyl-D-erythritol kinase
MPHDRVMQALTEIAYAKINLALHVRSRRDDGYHVLETLFAFAEDGDVLTLSLSDQSQMSIMGPFASGLSDGPDNLVLQAVDAVRQVFHIEQNVAITLDKRLPIAAGIGGGSADAAAVIRLMVRQFELNIDDPKLLLLAARLGADVPACVISQTVRGEGVGDELFPVDGTGLSGCAMLLVNPLEPCPTGPVFQAWDGRDRGPLETGTVMQTALSGRNDLEAPACQIVPEIAPILETLRAAPGVRLVRMSGSGATCFALFEDAENCSKAAGLFPNHWSLATRLR